jgi:hypothetical protein
LVYPAFSQNKLFHPQQLCEDAEFYFQTIEQVHPNPYAYKSIGYVERLKKSILDRLTHVYDMDQGEFYRILATMNHCFDTHANIGGNLTNSFVKKYIEEDGKILPPVHIEGDSVFMAVRGEKVKLTSINGIRTADILSTMKLYFSPEQKNVHLLLCEENFAGFLLLYCQKSPYELIGISAKNEKIHWIEEGVPGSSIFPKKKYAKYRHFIFETDSMAILELNSFDQIDHDKFRLDMIAFFDSIRVCGVKHLFVDLTRNKGGKLSPGLILLDFIKHDTVFYTCETARKVSRQSRDLGFKCPEEDIGKMIRESYHKTILLPPQPAGYTGKMYFLQGLGTMSAADQLCRIVAQNVGLGVRIGRETGTPTEFYSYTLSYKLPNTGLSFSCPVYYYHIPVPTAKDGFVYPDISYSLENLKTRNASQLKEILTHAKNDKKE